MAKKMFCTNCGSFVKRTYRNRGSYVVLLFLLLFFVIPGIFYFIYMATGTIDVCRACKSENTLVPENSPQATLFKKSVGVE